jgi:hypothetical protein
MAASPSCSSSMTTSTEVGDITSDDNGLMNQWQPIEALLLSNLLNNNDVEYHEEREQFLAAQREVQSQCQMASTAPFTSESSIVFDTRCGYCNASWSHYIWPYPERPCQIYRDYVPLPLPYDGEPRNAGDKLWVMASDFSSTPAMVDDLIAQGANVNTIHCM